MARKAAKKAAKKATKKAVKKSTKKKAKKPKKAKKTKKRKAKRVSKIAKGKRAKASVFKGSKAKTTGGLTKDKLMKSKSVKEPPDAVLEKLASTDKSIKSIVDECRRVLQKGGELSYTIHDVSQLAKTAALQRNFVNSLLQTRLLSKMPC